MTTLRTLLAVSETKSTQNGESKEHPDLRLGMRLINDIRKKGIITSHDIVPVEDQPKDGTWGLYHHLKYGEKKGQKFADDVHTYQIVVDVSQQIMKEFRIKGEEQCERETWELCPTRFGIAECGSLSRLLAMDLVKAGCNRKINKVCVIQNFNTELNYAHEFIVIGDCSAINDKKSESLNNFDKLGDDCILLDPKLKITGKAKDFKVLYAKYIEAFGYNRIHQVEEIDPAAFMKKIPTIESNVDLVCASIQERAGLKMLSKSHLDDPDYLKKVVNVMLGCCKMLKDSPELQETVRQQMTNKR